MSFTCTRDVPSGFWVPVLRLALGLEFEMLKKTLNYHEICTQKMLEAALKAWCEKIDTSFYVEVVRLDLKSKHVDNYIRVTCQGMAYIASQSGNFTRQLRFEFSIDWGGNLCPIRWPNNNQGGETLEIRYVEEDISGRIVYFQGRSLPEKGVYEISHMVSETSLLDFALHEHFRQSRQ